MMLSTVSSNGFGGGFAGAWAKANCVRRERAQSEVISFFRKLILMVFVVLGQLVYYLFCCIEKLTHAACETELPQPACEGRRHISSRGRKPADLSPKKYRAREAGDRLFVNGSLSPASRALVLFL